MLIPKGLTVSVLFLALSLSVHGIEFLEWGDKCSIPRQGGDPLTEECDAGKGLVCTGQACECTYKQRYSYDHVSKECRRRVGKPCQYVDLEVQGREALDKLPFNLKCHENAKCEQLELPSPKLFRPSGVVDIDKVSMCVCKKGYVASKDLNACVEPPPPVQFEEIFNKAPMKKLQFRAPYYTT